MPRSSKGRNPKGLGSIRKKTVVSNGKTYIYWEARYTMEVPNNPREKKQVSVTGKTKKEAGEKLKTLILEAENGTYSKPVEHLLTNTPVNSWLDIWADKYLSSIKASTKAHYEHMVRLYLKPNLEDIELCKLSTDDIQELYNAFGKDPYLLSPKSIKNIHGVLHKALEQAIANGYIKKNPASACVLPKIVKKEIKPLKREEIVEFLKLVEGHPHEHLYKIALFTGMREGEILGLTWDCVDFKRGLLTVKQQLQRAKEKGGTYYIAPTKNEKVRILTLPPAVIKEFVLQEEKQDKQKESVQDMWTEKPKIFSVVNRAEEPFDLVFRNPVGERLSYRTVYDCYKRIVQKIGRPDSRFHDLRHTYAVVSLEGGDSIKTLQENLGHSSPVITMETYGHVSVDMRVDSADRMERYIQDITV